ncbi:SH3 domain-containing protein [Tsuneonella sp. YG55]|uniref:SH3 domain-containing protein n=1 Tax=Tsuneonella litorea TaxID=2976475 RepID=A0A9X2W0Z7_9SPHN|nr:SH3 domain-containing protein [Tsuneonella litorea]MCT2558727.1 SH3 domain-containing protein [Tsuneonella litorea]
MRFYLIPAVTLAAAPVAAQDREVPYWATIKAEKLNMRAGPGRDFPIRWVYTREGLPLKVIRVHEGWRLVQDPAGDEGWVTANLLSKERGAIVVGEGLAAIRAAPSEGAMARWNAEPGVVGKLGKCESGWCEFDVAGRAGFVQANRLWGAGAR